jgi:hypothetical protein
MQKIKRRKEGDRQKKIMKKKKLERGGRQSWWGWEKKWVVKEMKKLKEEVGKYNKFKKFIWSKEPTIGSVGLVH